MDDTLITIIMTITMYLLFKHCSPETIEIIGFIAIAVGIIVSAFIIIKKVRQGRIY